MQRLITRMLIADVSDDPIEVLTAAHDFCAGEPRLRKSRAARQQLALLASSYFHWLRPPNSWTLVGSNEPIGAGFADLVWADPANRVLIDELKVATVMRWGLDLPSRHQVRAYVADATRRWGTSFIGVRVIKLSAPGLSLLVEPDLTYRPLSSTNLYFPTAAPAMHAPPSRYTPKTPGAPDAVARP